MATAQTALSNALLWNEQDLAARNRELLELYRSGRAYREPARTPEALPARPVLKPAE